MVMEHAKLEESLAEARQEWHQPLAKYEKVTFQSLIKPYIVHLCNTCLTSYMLCLKFLRNTVL